MRGVSPRKRKGKVKYHAFNSTAGSSHRGRCPPVAGESLHPHAGIYQIHPQWRRGHCGRFVAAECFWAVPFPCPHPRGDVKVERKPEICTANTTSIQRNTAGICL